MSLRSENWGTIHPSAYRNGAGLLRWAAVTRRAHGALRYVCPLTGSFVLVTDEATLQRLASPRAQVRCPDCGEMHLLLRDGDTGIFSPIVGEPAKS
jgi:hypothetical protein